MDEKSNFRIPLLHEPWRKNSNSIWLTTTICLHRNIDKFLFPKKLDVEKKNIITSEVFHAVQTTEGIQEPILFHLDELSPLERDYFLEHFLIFEAMEHVEKGQAYIIDKSESLFLRTNIHDHIELYIVDTLGELEKTYAKLVGFEQSLEKKLSFSFSPSFGYLTSDPCYSGTGLQVHNFLHVPALIFTESLSDVLETCQEGLSFTGLQGNPEDLIGNLLVVRNRWTTGVTEEMILSLCRNAVLHIMMQEKKMRKTILDEKNMTVIDKISRAVGVLQHSYTIDTSEALQSIGLIKFGIELGWVHGITLEEVNELFFDCRRAHLAVKTQSPALSDIHKTRAEFLQKALSQVAFSV